MSKDSSRIFFSQFPLLLFSFFRIHRNQRQQLHQQKTQRCSAASEPEEQPKVVLCQTEEEKSSRPVDRLQRFPVSSSSFLSSSSFYAWWLSLKHAPPNNNEKPSQTGSNRTFSRFPFTKATSNKILFEFIPNKKGQTFFSHKCSTRTRRSATTVTPAASTAWHWTAPVISSGSNHGSFDLSSSS